MTTRNIIAAALVTGALASTPAPVGACSRVVYHGADSIIAVGRSLDWRTPIPTNLWVYPRGLVKKSHNLPGAFEWEARYGSVYAVGYDTGITEGINEKGLTAASLFCKGAVYATPATAEGKRPMSLAVFIAWILDQNATTDEAVAMIRDSGFTISASDFDNGTVPALHFAITDPSGKTAILEFVDGKLNIYEGTDLDVLTNDPVYPSMEAINTYWEGIGGTHSLPGTVKSPDRFVRASFFNKNVRRATSSDKAVDIVRSIIMNVSVPEDYAVEGEPNLSSTQWRSVADLNRRRYYFDLVGNLGVFYIDLSALDLRPGSGTRRLDTAATVDFAGCANGLLRPTPPFTPAY